MDELRREKNAGAQDLRLKGQKEKANSWRNRTGTGSMNKDEGKEIK